MLRRALLAALLASLAAGCQAARASDRGAAVETLPVPDCGGTAGKVVVLDPGHGGKEAGAEGPDGLLEKDANLAVALELARRLEAVGATVHLTRTTDRAVLDRSLGEDLRERPAIANRIGADLFLSIHHNARQGERETDLTATETYYRMDDLGASLEAATSIHRYLVRALEPPAEMLIPGNYSVIRNARTAAVLGEAAYITHPGVARKLRTPEGVAQEAEAYFYGICDYFQPGVPRVLSLEVDFKSDKLRPEVVAVLSGGGSPLDPQAISLEVDGAAERPVLRGDRVVWRAPGPLANGSHSVEVWVRNLAGRTSVPATASISINEPPAAITLSPAFDFAPSGGPAPVQISIVDVLGRPVADGTKIKLKASAGELAQDEIVTHGGHAAAYLIRIPKAGATLTASAGAISAAVKVPGASRPALMGLVTARGGQPVAGAQILVTSTTRSMASRTNREGLWWLQGNPGGLREIRVWAPGYREEILDARAAAFRWTELEPVAGLWVDQTVVLDPEGGDARRDAAAMRAQDASWRTARQLKAIFEAAGANVILTRRPDEGQPDVVRMRVANSSDAVLYVRIGHLVGAAPQSRAEHHPNNKLTGKLAGVISANLARALGVIDAGAVPNTSYPLLQTTTDAVVIYTGGIEQVPEHALEARCRLEADAIFRGLMPPEPNAAFIKVVAQQDRKPVANALVRLDGAWIGQTGPDGAWIFPGMPPGQHLLTIDDGKRIRHVRVMGVEAGESREVVVEMERPEIPDDLG
ncbi:MAG: N-acetylmuramoyl-L-alanine amidase [Candidatus Sericytochromatia bacterium]|nr:N-acetylmuramoyl-L-alanine amidase [Candidatus Tanganyikabacteria bacterium]